MPPVLKMYRLTDVGTTYNNVLSKFNDTGGPQGVRIGPGADAGEVTAKFGDIQAGQWGVPKVFVWVFEDSGSVSGLKFRLYDAVSNLEDFFPGGGDDYDFRIKLNKDYVDPTTYTSSNFTSWPTLPHGSGVEGYDISTNKPNPGNDGNNTLLVAHDTFSDTWVMNCYLYVVFKNDDNSIAGTHTDWSYRVNWLYT